MTVELSGPRQTLAPVASPQPLIIASWLDRGANCVVGSSSGVPQDDGGVGIHVRDAPDGCYGQPDPRVGVRDHQTLPGDGERLPGGVVPQQEGERVPQAAATAHREQAEGRAQVRPGLGRAPPQRRAGGGRAGGSSVGGAGSRRSWKAAQEKSCNGP